MTPPLPRAKSLDQQRLVERRKELRGLYAAARAVAESATYGELFERTCRLVPPAWKYPEVARCSIHFDGQTYQSSSFEKSDWCQSANITVSGQVRGHIEVYYTERRPSHQEGPFLSEERELLEGLAEMVAGAVARIDADTSRRDILDIIDESPAIVFRLKNTPGLPVDYVSRNIESILGYRCEDFTSGRINYASILHEDDRAQADIAVRHRPEATSATYRVRTKDGEVRWVEDRTTAVRDSTGEITHFQGIILDATPRKLNEELLEIRVRLSECAVDHTLFEIIERAINEMERLTDSEIGLCHSLADDQECLTLEAWSSKTRMHANLTDPHRHHAAVSQAGVWVECVRHKKTVIHNDYPGLPSKKGLPSGHIPLSRQLMSPVFRGDKIVAIFGVGNKPRDYTEDDAKLIESLADAVWDIVAAKMAQDSLVVVNRALRIIGEFNQALVGTNDEADLLEQACRILVERGNYRLAWIGFAANDEAKTVHQVAGFGAGCESIDGLHMTWGDTSLGQTPIGTAIRTWGAKTARNIVTDPNLELLREAAAAHGYASCVAVPLVADDMLLGVLSVCSERPDAFDSQELEVLTELARDIGHGVMILRAKMQHRQREEALRQSEAHLQSVFNSTPDYLSLLDRKFRIQMINRIGPNATMQDVLGRPVTDFIVAEDRPHANEVLELVLRTGEPGKFESRQKRPDGSVRYFSVVAAPLLVSGQVTGLVVSSRDITDTVNLQDEKLRLEGLYRQAQKMEAIGRLAGGVAHDFNNLLTVINSYSSMAIESLSPQDPLSEDLREILGAGERAARLTHRLLAFSRKQVTKRGVININAVVTELKSMLRRLIGEDIDLHTNLSADLAHVRADPSQIEQVIMNLAVNARDAMVTGGQLSIDTANVELLADDITQHEALHPGPYVRLQVRDDGSGMTGPTIEKIFEPFFTTKKLGQGTGLGLAMVYGIIKQSDGAIAVDSTIDKGTTFSVYMPAVDAVSEAAAAPQPAQVRTMGTETILVVEDEASVRELTRKILVSSGYTVLEATNGNDALLLYGGRRDDIDLVVTDVVMPLMSGPELAKRLKVMTPAVKVLFVSGYTGDRMTDHGFIQPEIGFLIKPFTSSQLLLEVEDALKSQRSLTRES